MQCVIIVRNTFVTELLPIFVDITQMQFAGNQNKIYKKTVSQNEDMSMAKMKNIV